MCDEDKKKMGVCSNWKTDVYVAQRLRDSLFELKFICEVNKLETEWFKRDYILEGEHQHCIEIADTLHVKPKTIWKKTINSIITDKVFSHKEREGLDTLINDVAVKLDVRNFTSDDMAQIRYEISEWLLRNHVFATLKDTEEIYWYNDGVYSENAEPLIKQIVNLCLKQKSTTYQANEILNYIKRSTYTDRKDFQHDNLLCVANGILNLETKTLQPHTHETKFFCKLPVEYDENAKCPEIEKFIEEVVTTKQLNVLKEWLGYCLYPKYLYHKALMLIGEGSNGKTTLLNLIEKFLGIENISNVSLQDICNNRFASSTLHNKLANIYDDLPDKALLYTGKFKMLTGNGTIQAERKWQHPFTFKNYAKMVFATNKIPETHDDTLAFFRRWIIINCPNIFTGKTRDPKILEKLSTPTLLSGLLNWSLNGLRTLQENPARLFIFPEIHDFIRSLFRLPSF